MGTWALELMRDEGGPAIFWNAWSGSVGWVVFDSVYDCFSWLAWQVDPDRLGDPAHWGETYRRLERFHERLEDAEPPDDTAEALAVVRRHLRRVEALLAGRLGEAGYWCP